MLYVEYEFPLQAIRNRRRHIAFKNLLVIEGSVGEFSINNVTPADEKYLLLFQIVAHLVFVILQYLLEDKLI